MPPPSSISTAKCRQGLDRLRDHGIETSIPHPSTGSSAGPDAFLADTEGRAWLGIIWPGDTLQPKLITDHQPVPTLEETIRGFFQWVGSQGLDVNQAPQVIVFAPDLIDEDCQNGRVLAIFARQIIILGKRVCAKPKRIAEAIRRLDSAQTIMNRAILDRWRAATEPAADITADSRMRRRVDHEAGALIAPLLLDYDQERCAKLDLAPTIPNEPVSRDFRVRLITGVAGCGKTLILLQRAAYLSAHFPGARVLLVSHNRPLIADLNRRLRKRQAACRIKCQTFFQWLRSVSPPRNNGQLLTHQATEAWIDNHRRAFPTSYLSLARHNQSWLAEEIAWIFDHGHFGDAYLTAERRGRGLALQPTQRQEILALATSYRHYLIQHGQSDWNEWPYDAWQQWETKTVAPFRHDHLLIDEAQFFAPIWLDLLRRALRPGGHLFLCADPTQGFLKRRQSWSSLGIDMRSRSVRLERPYRSTKAILSFAERFYRERLPDDDEPLNLPSALWLDTIPAGQCPLVIPIPAGEPQLKRLIDELQVLRNNGVHLADVLILIAGQKLNAPYVVNRLASHFGAKSVGEIKDERLPEDALGVAHLMAATGLEKPIVFLLGIDELFSAENDPTLPAEVRLEKTRDHTRQIYVGLTRAMERLVIFALRERFPEPDANAFNRPPQAEISDQTGSHLRSNPVSSESAPRHDETGGRGVSQVADPEVEGLHGMR